MRHIQNLQENRLIGSVSRTMAAMSLGFIVMVTPWAIQEVVAACTGSKVKLDILKCLSLSWCVCVCVRECEL